MSNQLFYMDGYCLYHQGKPFTLKLCDFLADYDPQEHNCCKIPVDLSSEVPLDFSFAKESAQKIIDQGGWILWDLYIDFPTKLSQMRFEGLFNVHFHSLKIFSEQLIEPFKNASLGSCLFQASAEVDRIFRWSEADTIEFQEWLEDLYATPEHLFETTQNVLGDLQTFQDLDSHMLEVTPFSRHLRNVYTMHVLMSYLHRLAAALPEDLLVCVSLFTAAITHDGFLAQLLSKERFSHIHLLLDQTKIPLEGVLNCTEANNFVIGVCFPNDPQCLLSNLQQMKKLFDQLQASKIPYKIVPEFLMTSSWDGLDYMIFSKKSLGPQGKRMLQGFVAAGGTAVYLDEPLGLETEESLESLIESRVK